MNKFQAIYFFKKQFDDWKHNDGHITKMEQFVSVGKHMGKKALCFEQGNFPYLENNNSAVAIVFYMNETHITEVDLSFDFLDEEVILQRSKDN